MSAPLNRPVARVMGQCAARVVSSATLVDAAQREVLAAVLAYDPASQHIRDAETRLAELLAHENRCQRHRQRLAQCKSH